jgi:hypothetical protein
MLSLAQVVFCLVCDAGRPTKTEIVAKVTEAIGEAGVDIPVDVGDIVNQIPEIPGGGP